jgi:outer membrane lipoprotein-sorting protein
MNCTEFRDHLAELFDHPSDGTLLSGHLAECDDCRSEVEQARVLHARLQQSADRSATPGDSFADAIMSQIKSSTQSNARRYIMLRRLSVAAAAILTLTCFLVWGLNTQAVRADQLLQQGADALAKITNLHITARMRTSPADNPASIELDQAFVPLEIYSTVEDGIVTKWRIEKPQRIMVMDGVGTYVYIPSAQMAVKFRAVTPRQSGNLAWMASLLEPRDVLENELKNARTKPADVTVTEEQNSGRKIAVVTVESKAAAKNAADDWLKNKIIEASDTRRTYRFDAKTSRLIGMQILVHTEKGDVLVFETTKIEFPDTLAENLFAITLPKDVEWQDMEKRQSAKDIPEVCAPDKKPEEVARSFFEAFATGKPGATDPYMMLKMKFPDEVYAVFKDLKIISIGDPDNPGLSNGNGHGVYFIPYKIQLTNGETKEFRLNVRNDNPLHRWYVDGGF